MTEPITINFDYAPKQNFSDGIAHLLKIYQGAPYNQSIGVQSEDGSFVRDFSAYENIRMQTRLTQTSDVLFELSKAAGTIIGTSTRLQLTFPASITEALTLPLPFANAAIVNEVRFVHDIELINGGVVVERFAQGIGYIVINTTRTQ